MSYRSLYGRARAPNTVSKLNPPNGGLNAIGAAPLIHDSQWSVHYGWHVNRDGTISQREGDWGVVGSIAGSCWSLTSTDFERLYFFDGEGQGDSYLHYPCDTAWYVANTTAVTETHYHYPTQGCLPRYFCTPVQFNTASSKLCITSYMDTAQGVGTPELAAMTYSGGTISVCKPAIWGSNNPRALITHSNRIFAITGNMLSWSRGGIWNSWWGSTADKGYVAEDNGYWVFERESQLLGMVEFDGSLYLYGDKNVYRFSGYEPANFVSEIVLPNVGLYDIGRVCAGNRFMYYFSDGEIWEYSGGTNTHTISSGTSVAGGIPHDLGTSSPGYINMVADEYRLVVHYFGQNNGSAHSSWAYEFNLDTRTWEQHGSTTMRDVQSSNGRIYQAVTYDHVDLAYRVALLDNVGYRSLGTYDTNGKYQSVLVSKAFSFGPSTLSALANLWLQYKLDDTTTATDITVSLSRKASGDEDWVVIYRGENILGTGDIQTQRVMVPIQYTLTSEFYRFMIECEGALMTLYPYTREINVRSRE